MGHVSYISIVCVIKSRSIFDGCCCTSIWLLLSIIWVYLLKSSVVGFDDTEHIDPRLAEVDSPQHPILAVLDVVKEEQQGVEQVVVARPSADLFQLVLLACGLFAAAPAARLGGAGAGFQV